MTEQVTIETMSITPTTSSATASEAEIAWMRRCLPIIVQPEVDLRNGDHLVKVYFRFERDAETGRLDCKLCTVFASESSYNRIFETRQNVIATLFYRSFNRKTYHRTADIDYLEFRNVDLDPSSSTPWGSIYSFDHAGEQRWAQGAKGNICCWFSLMHHYKVDVPFAEWEKDGVRPRIYLNTSNHLFGERDNNPSLTKHDWTDYPFQEGDAEDAFLFAVDHVPTRFNLYSLCCFWKARNGGGRWCDRHATGAVTHSRESIYIQVPSTSKTSDATAQNGQYDPQA